MIRDPRGVVLEPYNPQAPIPEALPEQKQFPTDRDALVHYEGLIRSVEEPTKPWLGPLDGSRRVEHLCASFAHDWPLIVKLFAAEELWGCLKAYQALPSLVRAWQYGHSRLEQADDSGGTPAILRTGFDTRDKLLALARLAYGDDPAAQKELDRIALRTQRSFYDEASTDLGALVALFQANEFETQGFVVYPTELLGDAAKTAKELPLFAPKADKRGKQSQGGVMMLRQVFELTRACYERLRVAGRCARAWDPEVDDLYPGFSPLKG